MKTIVVREYARLTTVPVDSTLDQATITPTAFEWLCNLAAGFNKNGAPLLQIENARWLKLDSYVGIIETPCGTLLEILPKHTDKTSETSTESSRALLIKMLTVALDLPVRTTDKTDIRTFNHPLLEWVMKQFILSLEHLIKRGIRFDYQRVEEEQRYLRGQLDIVKQMRQPPGRQHIFPIRHDVFLADRPENRLLKSALMLVCRTTQQPDTWRLSHELMGLLAEIPVSKEIRSDFLQWRNDRLMAHYQSIRPWCELVLGEQMPLALRGKTHGISLLFPMEKLFERYVEIKLKKLLPAQFTLRAQAKDKSLCTHAGTNMFQLRPDFIVQQGKKNTLVMDAKWKLLSSTDRENKYGLSQSDFYQMFAYGHKYLEASGEMLLIYPRTTSFFDVLPSFHYSPELRLWVAPFDLENDVMYWPLYWNETIFSELRQAG